MSFKIGDRVRISTTKWGMGPYHAAGEVVDIRGDRPDYPYMVKLDEDSFNRPEDMKLYKLLFPHGSLLAEDEIELVE